MRATVAKKLKRAARLQAERVFAENVTMVPKWYARKWVFSAWAMPFTQLVRFVNWLGWHSAGRWWVNYCRAFRRRGNVLVVRRSA